MDADMTEKLSVASVMMFGIMLVYVGSVLTLGERRYKRTMTRGTSLQY